MKRIFLILMVCLVYNWQALYAQINTLLQALLPL